MSTTENNTTAQIIDVIIAAWTAQNDSVVALFAKYDDERYLQEVAPGRNRAIYLLGHLIASNDNLLPLLGLGDKLYPELEDTFSTNPDYAVSTIPTIEELRKAWGDLNEILSIRLATITPLGWLEKHTRVSDEDFALNTKRNKLNAFLGRITHQSYHAGQLAFLTERAVKN